MTLVCIPSFDLALAGRPHSSKTIKSICRFYHISLERFGHYSTSTYYLHEFAEHISGESIPVITKSFVCFMPTSWKVFSQGQSNYVLVEFYFFRSAISILVLGVVMGQAVH